MESITSSHWACVVTFAGNVRQGFNPVNAVKDGKICTTRECFLRFKYFLHSIGFEEIASVSSSFRKEPLVELRFDEIWVKNRVIIDGSGIDVLHGGRIPEFDPLI